jgi:hypothetical protein
MNSARNRALREVLAATAVAAVLCSLAAADDFHIDNKTYFNYKGDDKKAKPVETTTLFASGRVYDFLPAPEETIILDPGHDLIVILDPNRRLRTQITTGEISTQMEKLRQAALNHPKEAVRESAAAKFKESIDPETGELKLTNRWMQYVVESKAPERPQVARQYAEAADWLAQLNALLTPPNPPFARLALNRVLRDRQELPLKITLTYTPEGRGHKPTVNRSEHTILMSLSQRDRHRIDTAGQQMHTFNKVPFDEYHRVEEEQARPVEAQASVETNQKR